MQRCVHQLQAQGIVLARFLRRLRYQDLGVGILTVPG